MSLNAIPTVQKLTYESDHDFLVSQHSHNSVFLLTSKLFSSESGRNIRSSLTEKGYQVLLLSTDLTLDSDISSIFILGLETQWIDNLAEDRKQINILREDQKARINLVFVRYRDNKPCQPSLISHDF